MEKEVNALKKTKFSTFHTEPISKKLDLPLDEVIIYLDEMVDKGELKCEYVLVNEDDPSIKIIFQSKEKYQPLLHTEYDFFEDDYPIYLEEDMIERSYILH